MSVLVGTKVKDAELWLPRFINQVEQLEGDVSRVAVIYGESRDQSLALLKHWQRTSKRKIEIYAEPYLPESERNGYSLARLKQDLQKILRDGAEQYYLNLDCDLVELPKTLIADLQAADKDLVAAMIWTENRVPRTFFDTYVYRLEGCMFHPYKPPGLNATDPFPVDSVSTCYLAKREVEVAGTYSNPHPHIPFCASLKKLGYQIWVHPQVYAYHVDLEKYGIMHNMIQHPYSYAPFITCTGQKVNGQMVGAERFQLDREAYDRWINENRPAQAKQIEMWLDKRPLITASYKVLNEAEYLNCSLESIYPYVDRIDIVYGVVKQADHIVDFDNTPQIIQSFPDPDKKIRFVTGKWKSKEQVQAKLLEICESKWMLYIDGDEVLDPQSAQLMRDFCLSNQSGEAIYARPMRFLNFLHDFRHVAYSINPLSPWAQYGLPHPFLIWRSIPGLNFGAFHTLPSDGFGEFVHVDNPRYQGKQKIIEGCTIYHFGNAKNPARTLDKLRFERRRDNNPSPAESDWWFTGVLPPDFAVEDFDPERLPAVMRGHPYFGDVNIRVTQTQPNYKFERLKK